MKILFIIHADNNSGGGHFQRSLVLARKLSDYPQTIINFSIDHLSKHYIEQCPFKKISNINSAYDLIVYDGYIFNNEHINKTKIYTKKTMILDDLCNRYLDVNILWDPLPLRVEKDYASFTDTNTKLFIGEKYHLLEEDKNIFHSKPKFIHLYFGQKSSIKHYRIYKKISMHTNLPILYLSGLKSIFPYLKKIRKKDKIIPYTKNFNQTILQSLVCVGAPGSALWYRLKYKRKCVIISTNKNQIKICKSLHNKGIITYVGHIDTIHTKNKIIKIAKLILRHKNNYFNLRKNICKEGAQNLASELINEIRN